MSLVFSLLLVVKAWGSFTYPEIDQSAATDISENLQKTGELLCATHFNTYLDSLEESRRRVLDKQQPAIIAKCVETHRQTSRRCAHSYLAQVDKLANNEGLNPEKLKHIEEQLQPQLVKCLDVSNAQTKTNIKTFGELRQK